MRFYPKLKKIVFSMFIFIFFKKGIVIISFDATLVVFIDVNIGVFQLLLCYFHASDIVPCVSKI